MHFDKKRIEELTEKIEKARTVTAPENSVGQWIASFYATGLDIILKEIVDGFDDYNIKIPRGKKTWKLSSIYGEEKQIDHVISDSSGNPIVIIEDKWLKDQRHLKDKGSWIIALQSVQKNYDSIRGIIASLAGEWNETTIKALENVAYVTHIPTDHVYDRLSEIGIVVKIDKSRQAFAEPVSLLTTILDVVEENLPDTDIIALTGLKIVEPIKPKLEKILISILFPKEPEEPREFEFTIKSSWGRFTSIKGTYTESELEEIIRKVRDLF